eukprot:GCRY01002282.1.p1 GENE.GCRY01002282.1~~GCRY01002282.1.p1  ORF type:complete len:216 (+),score=33.78 GCRY01002282.1:167-814(+)
MVNFKNSCFIFGYGSLIAEESRSRTGVCGDTFVVSLKGFQRCWGVKIESAKCTALGVTLPMGDQKEVKTTGVLVNIPEEELPNFDKRERNYSRVLVDWSQVEFETQYNQRPREYLSSKAYAYIATEVHPPTPEYPILQSYVDVILHGCLEYGEDFTKRFIQTSCSWQHILDDRAAPRYARPIVLAAPLQSKIDTLLASQLGSTAARPVKTNASGD